MDEEARRLRRIGSIEEIGFSTSAEWNYITFWFNTIGINSKLFILKWIKMHDNTSSKDTVLLYFRCNKAASLKLYNLNSIYQNQAEVCKPKSTYQHI